MIKYIITFFLFSIYTFAQVDVVPLPNQVGMSFEEIITMYPTYQTSNWYGQISYFNTTLPGKLNYNFHKNRCYALQYIFWTEDSTEALAVYNQYLAYVTERNGVNGYISRNWGDNLPVSLHHFWTGRPLGWGAVMYDATRIHYTNIQWDGTYYLVWMSMFRDRDASAPGGIPLTKPSIKL